MRLTTFVAQSIVRVCVAFQVVSGLLFWTGNQLQLVPLHMLSGSLVVLGLWTLAGLAARAGASLGRVALAVGWGGLVLALGMSQTQILEGDLHWVVQLLHLAVGLAAAAQAEQLGALVRRRTSPPTTRMARELGSV